MRKAAILLAAALLAGSVFAADQPKNTKKATAAGILTDIKPDPAKPDTVMLWTDGEDAPVKFTLGEGFDKKAFGFPPAGKGIFTTDRVQFTYTKGDEGNTLLAIRKERTLPKGTVTGVVLFSNDFWVAVKPKVGPPDGYAIGAGSGPINEKLKTLQKGDIVTIKFHTDIERHRIDALTVVRAKPAGDPPATNPPAR